MKDLADQALTRHNFHGDSSGGRSGRSRDPIRGGEIHAGHASAPRWAVRNRSEPRRRPAVRALSTPGRSGRHAGCAADVGFRTLRVPAMCAEGVMGSPRWSDLSTRSRRLIIAAAVAEGVLKTAALIDLKRRPASQIRGSKWLWAPAVVVINSFGGVPLAYFIFGRRRQRRSVPG